MIHFEGQEQFSQPLTAVYAALSDAGWLAKSLPDAEVTEAAADRAGWKVRPKFAFMSGNLDTTAEVMQRQDAMVQYKISSRGVGSNSTVLAQLVLAPSDTGTTVHWKGELVELGGLLKMVPRGLIQAAAQKVIADVWQAIHQKL